LPQTALPQSAPPKNSLESIVGFHSPYQPHKLVVPVLIGKGMTTEVVDELVAEAFGPADSRSQEIPFEFTHYYDKEMRTPITRVLYSIAELIEPTELARLKHLSNSVEARTAAPDGRRVINLDPGLLSLSRLILATTKPSAHRIPIGQGIHAEITLLFQRGGFQPLDWTYPDFRSQIYHDWLLTVRRRYHSQLKEIDAKTNWRL
jgi:Domain of unknown function (DUF4416)